MLKKIVSPRFVKPLYKNIDTYIKLIYLLAITKCNNLTLCLFNGTIERSLAGRKLKVYLDFFYTSKTKLLLHSSAAK